MIGFVNAKKVNKNAYQTYLNSVQRALRMIILTSIVSMMEYTCNNGMIENRAVVVFTGIAAVIKNLQLICGVLQ